MALKQVKQSILPQLRELVSDLVQGNHFHIVDSARSGNLTAATIAELRKDYTGQITPPPESAYDSWLENEELIKSAPLPQVT